MTRNDFALKNPRGLHLECSLYTLVDPSTTYLIYCHGSQGNRLDSSEALFLLFEYEINICCFDFAGSGLSEGSFISLGYYEKDDIVTVVKHLKKQGARKIGLWGRSMGAVASLLYATEKPGISFIIADSAFSDLRELINELIKSFLPLPNMIVSYIASKIKQKIYLQTGFWIE